MSDDTDSIIERLIAERDAAIERAARVQETSDAMARTLRDTLVRADVLAAECRAWRLNADHPLWDYIKEAVAATDAAKALDEPS